jgi:DNA-binding response OmpR family regulator
MATEEPDKILVVDDSPQISKALSDLLSTSGYLVRTAPSAERALQILESATFDLIITDLKMTGMTGIDLARQVLQKTPGLPVVILTGFGDMDSVIHALRLGVADYLKKPFSIDEVTSVVEREIAKSKGRQAAPVAVTPSEKPPRLYIFGQRDLEQIEAVLSRLRAQATAESAMLVEQAGYVIAAKGMSSGADVKPLSNLIANSRSTQRPWRHYWVRHRTFPPVTWRANGSASIPLRWGATCTWPSLSPRGPSRAWCGCTPRKLQLRSIALCSAPSMPCRSNWDTR